MNTVTSFHLVIIYKWYAKMYNWESMAMMLCCSRAMFAYDGLAYGSFV